MEPGAELYDSLSAGNIVRTLCSSFGVTDLWAADLPRFAEDYIRGLGLPDETIAALKDGLGSDHPAPVEAVA